ncbi:MAG: CpaF family protein [Actinomycetia bacterium]|nr:CpaF family protein [Actinomycetes bacterium]
MSLLELLNDLGGHDLANVSIGNLRTLREEMRQMLYQQLPSTRIAELLEKDKQRAKREVEAVLEQISASAAFSHLSKPSRLALVQEVEDFVIGLGPIEALLRDTSVSEVMVNGFARVYYEQHGRIHSSDVVFDDEDQLRMIIDRIVGPLGRRVDESSPMVSARLSEGHRVNVVIPPLAPDGTVLTIRKFREQMFTLDELTAQGSMDGAVAELLRLSVRQRRNIVVSGGTGSGKTTLLNALSVEIPAEERIITIEDAAELRFHSHPHVVRLEARMKSCEGAGEVTIRDLVTNSLRMRPDRIVVGECRGAEALDMLQAMNTGHDGSLTTLHANSPTEVVSRLVMMCRYGMDLPVSVLDEQIANSFDLIVHVQRDPDGFRRVTSIYACGGGREGVELQALVAWQPKTGNYLWYDDAARGILGDGGK